MIAQERSRQIVERVPEPELMNGVEQARAYAEGDFDAPHSMFIDLLCQHLADIPTQGTAIDLGCGPADITLRFARAFPHFRVHGVDASPRMLELGYAAVKQAGLEDRVRLFEGYLPGAVLPRTDYDIVISNSLLHHLADPAVLWREVSACGRAGTAVFVMDLLRPETREAAVELRDEYASNEPAVLRDDFFNSLLAAYRPEEVIVQLRETGLESLSVAVVSDRHFIVHGVLS